MSDTRGAKDDRSDARGANGDRSDACGAKDDRSDACGAKDDRSDVCAANGDLTPPVDPSAFAPADAGDRAVVQRQLGRAPRAIRAVAHRCNCGLPDVIETSPRLPDGTPFPTLYYLTCPRAASAIGRLEASGLMSEMTDRLKTDNTLADRYRAAHESYLARRRQLGDVPEIDGISAGGMPNRVKCLHVLIGHALAAGPGVNPLGDEALALLPDWSAGGPCVDARADGVG